MPVSFSLALDPATAVFPSEQIFLIGILKATRNLKAHEDPTGGFTAKMAEQGVRSVPAASVSEKDVLCVVDHGYYEIDELRVGKFIEYLLNDKYYRLTTGWAQSTNNDNSTAYPPKTIRPIQQPSALATLMGKVIPAPINAVPVKDMPPRPDESLPSEEYMLSPAPASEYEKTPVSNYQRSPVTGGGSA